ncbi:MAG: Ig-like domain-containing protein [Candidatus Micrarchaeota archaeon]|nr:Ig-like domain-containing protein [Candidatus Micrarchaeota archaeon]
MDRRIIYVFLFALFSGAIFASDPSFVSVQSGRFMLNNQPFYFSGTNAYYLVTYEKLDPAYVTNTLNLFANNNVTVVRMWGFFDGYPKSKCSNYSGASDPSLQPLPGVYNESALRLMDSVVKKAKDRNIKLIISFVNFWGDLGGICQYNQWANYSGSYQPTHDEAVFFFTNPTTKQWYKNYVSMILNRVNTQTGVAYKDEPTIMAWELINEGRIPQESDITIIRNWYQEMAQHIKSIDNKHLVTTGEEGFENAMDYSGSPYSRNLSNTYVLRAGQGTSYIANIQIPEIDFGQIHVYPDAFGFSTANNYSAWFPDSVTYINDHARITQQYGKPMLIGEYGSSYVEGWVEDSLFKRNFYSYIWANNEQNPNVAGDLHWQFVIGPKCTEYGGNICATRDPILTSMFNQHGYNMKMKSGGTTPSDTTPPTVSITHSPANPTSTQNITLTATASDASGIKQIQIYLDGALAKTCTSATSCTHIAGPFAANTVHTYYATATDNSANANTGRDPASGTKNFTISQAAQQDTTPPTVSITSPANGSTVNGTITITATASDNVAVAGVQFKVDGANLGSEDTTAPYSVVWNSSSVSPGQHTISAVARDTSNNTATATIVVNVAAEVPPADTTPPTVSVSHSPANPTSLDRVTVTAEAYDASGIAYITIMVDNKTAANCTTSPCKTTAARYAIGTHTYSAIAVDKSSNANKGYSAVKSFVVVKKGTKPTTTIQSTAALDAASSITYTREVSGDEETTTVALSVTNPTDTEMKNVLLKEKIPAAFATDPTKISFSQKPSYFESGSIVAVWEFAKIKPKEKISITYSVAREASVKASDFKLSAAFKAPPEPGKEAALSVPASVSAPEKVVIGKEVSVQLTDAAGKPLKNVLVSIKGPEGETVDYMTDQQGTLRFTPEVSGKYYYLSKEAKLSAPAATEVLVEPEEKKPAAILSKETSDNIGLLIALFLVVIAGAVLYLSTRKKGN